VNQEEILDRCEHLLDTGVATANLGQLTEAVAELHAAFDELSPVLADLEQDGKRVVERATMLAARIKLSLAFPEHELGREEAAGRSLDEAEGFATRGRHVGMTVLIHAQRGAVLLRSGRLEDSLTELDRAARLLRHAPGIDQFKIMLNRGEVHGLLGHFDQARADLSRAAELGAKHQLTSIAFYASHNLGLLEFLCGNLPRALELMPIERANSDFSRGIVGIDRAKVLLSAGLLSEADRSLVEACAALERTELVQFLAEAELLRAEVALLAGSAELAQSLSRAAVARLRPRDNRRATVLGELVQLRADAAAGVGPDQLIVVANRLARTLETMGLPDQSRLARLIAIEQLPLDQVGSRALPRIDRSQPLELRLYGRLVRANLAFARGDGASGLRHARLGLAELTEYQTQFGSLDLQTSSAVRAQRLAAAAITAEIAADRPTAVLAWVERARAVSGRVVALQPPEDQVTANLLTQLRWTASQAEREEADGRDTNELRRRRHSLEQEIRARSWTVRGSGAVVAEPRTADLLRALGESVLVALFNLHEVVYAVVLTRQHCWLRRLAGLPETEELGQRIRADLDVLALDMVPDALRRSARGSLRRSLERLDKLLIAPLDLPDAPVVLLPPGRLTSLPWAGLPGFRGRPVAVAPSASTWLGAHARFVFAPGPVVAVAGPGLRRADDEVERVADIWPGCQVLRPAEVTVAAFLSSINGAQLVHVAAHGRHERENPLFSSISLADGPVVGYDLERVPDPPQQVVLSACDLGQATVRPGEEALGLTRAFLHSGSSTVISGVAKVSDGGAADLMADYHRRLAAGSTPAYALADALAAADDPMPFGCFGAGW
jgi:tetratricopeptide (TPR) repeat protein